MPHSRHGETGLEICADIDVDTESTREVEVSIVICTRNRASRLPRTLGALRALRSQHAYEVIWVDNASSDNTAAVLKSELADDSMARYIFGERMGLGAARNTGWKASRGKIVAFTDDDCYPSPDYVDALIAAFFDYPDVGVIGGRILLYNPQHARITIEEGQSPHLFPRRSFLHPGLLQGANIAFRRAALEAIDGIDPELGAGTPFPCEDIDAVTAALWAGFDARFDPRPVVQHDHGRVEADVPSLLRSYDRGRGSFFAKYILRSDTRAVYVVRWLRSAWLRRDWPGIRALRTEMATAAQYALSKKCYGALLVALPIGIAVLGFQTMLTCLFEFRQWLQTSPVADMRKP
jgi:glycosyltransferase involved in cell wall biosynthesis